MAWLMLALAPSQAQGLRASTQAASAPAQADFIVAVVNSEPITNNQVRQELARVTQQFAQQRRTAPEPRQLAADVLESLIVRRVLLHTANETGLKLEPSAIDQAEQTIALQNQFDVAELRRRVVQGGQTVAEFRAELGEQMMLQRLRERDLEGRVRVTDQEVQEYQRAQQAGSADLSAIQLNLAQILVAVPESATTAQVEALRARAQRAQERALAGEDFAALVREFSQASDTANGGQLGLRPASRYPELFVQASRTLEAGQVAPLVRSPAGFHVLKVIEKSGAGLPSTSVTQSRARHILLVPGTGLSEFQARQKLSDFKKQLVSGQGDFAQLARTHSQDGSAAQGGDLGWASPGQFVPEFEDTMNRLAPGDISDPVVSRFGVHLIQLQERRQAKLSAEQQREAIRAMLRDKKMPDAYQAWTQELRARAYVEMREPPL